MRELVEDIVLKEHFVYSSSMPIKPMRIENKPIHILLRKLKDNNIIIDKDHSEKRIEYKMMISEGKSYTRNPVVPINSTIPIEHVVEKYYLRDGQGLELSLKNYDEDLTEEHGRMGGEKKGDYGIKCKVSLFGEEPTYDIFDVIKKCLYDTYKVKNKNKNTNPAIKKTLEKIFKKTKKGMEY